MLAPLLLTTSEFVIGITPYFDLLVNVNKTLICQLWLQLGFEQHETGDCWSKGNNLYSKSNEHEARIKLKMIMYNRQIEKQSMPISTRTKY